jgi:hypothetical protein
MDIVMRIDDPVFLGKIYPSGELVNSIFWRNTIEWSKNYHFATHDIDANDDWGVLILGGDYYWFADHILRFDTNGVVVWEKFYDLFFLKQVLFLENEEFAMRTHDKVLIASPMGEIKETLEVENTLNDMVYLDQKLYMISNNEVFSWNINTLKRESILLNNDELHFNLVLNVINDSLWVLSGDKEMVYVTNVFSDKQETYKFSLPEFEIIKFFVTGNEIIMVGNTIQQQMALIAFSREETEPEFDWADIELVDFEINNFESSFWELPDDWPIFDVLYYTTQITLKNNGSDTIISFGIQSDRNGGFEPGSSYFYEYLDDLTILPGQTVEVNFDDGIFLYDTDQIQPYKLCYQVMAPNGRFEKNINNNLLCKTYDFTNINNVNADDGWRVYPNPATNHITLEAPELSPTKYQIFSADGRMILSGEFDHKTQTLNTSHLPVGIYIIKLQQGEKMGIQKILRQ